MRILHRSSKMSRRTQYVTDKPIVATINFGPANVPVQILDQAQTQTIMMQRPVQQVPVQQVQAPLQPGDTENRDRDPAQQGS